MHELDGFLIHDDIKITNNITLNTKLITLHILNLQNLIEIILNRDS